MAIVDIDVAVERARDKAIDELVQDNVDKILWPKADHERMMAYALAHPDSLPDLWLPDTDIEATEPFSIIKCLMKHKEGSAMWDSHARILARWTVNRCRQSLDQYEERNGVPL